MLSDLTVAELDELAAEAELEEYPRSGTKPEKIDALEAAGIEAPPEDTDTEPATDAGTVRVRPGTISPTLAAARDRERERAAELTAARREARTVNLEPASEALRAEAERTRRRELAGLDDAIVGTNPDPDAEGDLEE